MAEIFVNKGNGVAKSGFGNAEKLVEKIENYTLDELSPRIKVKKKYQQKLFLYFGNLIFIGLRR